MTVLLVLATFVAFLLIDFLYSRKRAVVPVWEPAQRPVAPLPLPNVVAGFQLPDHLRYHQGHTWALPESANLMRVGLDDFAARLIGKAERFALPERGRWVRQGQKLMTVFRGDARAEVVSPTEGIVVDVNDAVLRDPELAVKDPYGEGWLVTVQSPEPKTNLRNLFSGALARKWMEEAAVRLQQRMPALAGAVAQDGGIAVRDLSAQMSERDWTTLTHEFFLG